MVYAHKLAAALADVDAGQGWVLDQSSGVTPHLPHVECRGFAGAIGWLPQTRLSLANGSSRRQGRMRRIS
jgi:hypothetical protein